MFIAFLLFWHDYFVPGVILNSMEDQNAFVNIEGEDARHFLAGLSENIVLESGRAARMVSATVAARTRSCFLQAWVGLPVVLPFYSFS